MRTMTVLCCLVVGLLTGCSEARQARFSTRSVPRASSLSYNAEHKELSAKPPALDGDYHGSTDDTVARPRADSRIRLIGVDPMPEAGKSYKRY